MPSRFSSSRSATFDLVSCRDLLKKLEREIGRIKQATDRPEVCDHGTNAAFTAWHLTDWVWADVKDNWQIRAAIAKQAGRAANNFNLEELQDYVAGGSKDLEICRIIATASKHVGWEILGDVQELTATGSARGLNATGSARSALNIIGDPPVPSKRWILKIKIDGQSSEALPVFRNAFKYWQSFIEEHHIGAPEES